MTQRIKALDLVTERRLSSQTCTQDLKIIKHHVHNVSMMIVPEGTMQHRPPSQSRDRRHVMSLGSRCKLLILWFNKSLQLHLNFIVNTVSVPEGEQEVTLEASVNSTMLANVSLEDSSFQFWTVSFSQSTDEI